VVTKPGYIGTGAVIILVIASIVMAAGLGTILYYFVLVQLKDSQMALMSDTD
jgi:hypothetical protein